MHALGVHHAATGVWHHEVPVIERERLDDVGPVADSPMGRLLQHGAHMGRDVGEQQSSPDLASIRVRSSPTFPTPITATDSAWRRSQAFSRPGCES
jgi:hypothetical protein